MAERVIRSAVYTRKSTDEGLDQAFNSLDAQREACAAFIASQKHEGWQMLLDLYDDGGYSGGTMDRPGLKQLLADVQAGKVDVIVVYKVDRLTRSLADFAKIVEVLDQAGASFVSVTQAFNTTTSMGRLTLNVLLSFAQFEREVTGERIRDKVAASKKKGMWMGGPVPLGYKVRDRKLIVNHEEAATVRLIFQRYASLRSGDAVVDELAHTGIRTKLRSLKDGRQVGGVLFRHGPLYHLLNNPAYVGDVRHKGNVYAGQHEPIIDRELWEQVQSTLAGNRVERRIMGRGRVPSLLTGLLFDANGRIMSPTFAVKQSRRYRYYVSRGRTGERLPAHSKLRFPAGELERAIIERLTAWLRSEARHSSAAAFELAEQMAEGRLLAKHLEAGSLRDQRGFLLRLNARVELAGKSIQIELDDPFGKGEQTERVSIEWEASLVDRGSDLRLVLVPGGDHAARQPDPVLVNLVVHAFAARDSMLTGQLDPMTSDYSLEHRSRLVRLSYLAPDIITAIVEGRHPPSLSGRRLLRMAQPPLDWPAQRASLGFA